MPEEHARLSASKASRWINCPPSVALEERFEDQPSKYAEEGTLAHSIAEQKLTRFINRGRKKIPCDDKDMDDYTDQYLNYCVETFREVKKQCKDAIMMVEQRLDFSEWVPDGFGTGDCVIIGDGVLHIIDLKYGKGVLVEADENPQFRLYGLGAIKTYGNIYDFDKVCMHAFQPRLDSVSTEEKTVSELLQWAEDVVRPAAALAQVGKGDFKCGTHCKFCKAKATCKARMEYYMELKKYEEQDPRLLSKTDIQDILNKADDLSKWIDDVKEYALQTILEGEDIPGYKVVEGRSIRVYTDPAAIDAVLKENGYAEELTYEKKLITITKMEKLLGKKEFNELLGQYVDKPTGKPTLAPMTDKRPAISKGSAEEDFNDMLD